MRKNIYDSKKKKKQQPRAWCVSHESISNFLHLLYIYFPYSGFLASFCLSCPLGLCNPSSTFLGEMSVLTIFGTMAIISRWLWLTDSQALSPFALI